MLNRSWPGCRNDSSPLLIQEVLSLYQRPGFTIKYTMLQLKYTLSSARSFGKNIVGLMPLICEICTRLIAVLPVLASTTYFVELKLLFLSASSIIFLTALSLLLPNGFKNSHFIFINISLHKLHFLSLQKVWEGILKALTQSAPESWSFLFTLIFSISYNQKQLDLLLEQLPLKQSRN